MQHYYAEFRPYGIRTISEGMQLYRFDTRAERDEWVERMSRYPYCHPYRHQWHAVTVREISHRYDLRKFDNDPFNYYCHQHEGAARTSAGRIPYYVTTRPRYRF